MKHYVGILCFFLTITSYALCQSPPILIDKTLGGTGNDLLKSNTLLQTSDGGFLIGTYSYSGIGYEKSDTSRGFSDYWLVKTNNALQVEWDKTLGGTIQTIYLTLILLLIMI